VLVPVHWHEHVPAVPPTFVTWGNHARPGSTDQFQYDLGRVERAERVQDVPAIKVNFDGWPSDLSSNLALLWFGVLLALRFKPEPFPKIEGDPLCDEHHGS
jgi:hypothetical protein